MPLGSHKCLVEVVGLINYKNLSVVCSQNSHGQRISFHLVNSAKLLLLSQDLLFIKKSISLNYFMTIYQNSP